MHVSGDPLLAELLIGWLRPDAKPMTKQDWSNGEARVLGVMLAGAAGALAVYGACTSAIRAATVAARPCT